MYKLNTAGVSENMETVETRAAWYIGYLVGSQRNLYNIATSILQVKNVSSVTTVYNNTEACLYPITLMQVL